MEWEVLAKDTSDCMHGMRYMEARLQHRAMHRDIPVPWQRKRYQKPTV